MFLSTFTIIELPIHGYFGIHILVVPDEIHFLPDVTQEPILVPVAEVVGSGEPVRREDAYRELQDGAFAVGVQGKDEGGVIVPFDIVQRFPQLVVVDVEVTFVRPVVP